MAPHATRRRPSTPAGTAEGAARVATPTRTDLVDQVERLFGAAADGSTPLVAERDGSSAGSVATVPIDPAPHAARGCGVEIELICVHGSPPRPTPAARIRAALAAHDPELLTEARISFEPGGQLELSPGPRPTLAALLRDVDALLTRTRRALHSDRIVAVSSGMNPWHDADTVGLHLDADRYRVMQHHFDSNGPSGREMMRLTASLQVCVDRAPGEGGVAQWVLANRMGPALAAAFANSAVAHGGVTGWSSTRCHVWQQLDPTRTGFDGAHVDAAHPAAAYADFAARACALPLPRPGDDTNADTPLGTPFHLWEQAGGDRPDAEDVAHHLSTLFPPVRPRGSYWEIRYLDAPPLASLAAPLLTVHLLLTDAAASRQALDALDTPDRGALLALWHAAAHQGLANPWLRHEALTLVGIALAAARRLPADVVPPSAVAQLADYRDTHLCQARCWSDDQAARIAGPHAEDPTAWS